SSVSLVSLLPYGTRSTNGSGSAVTIVAGFRWITFELVVASVAGSGAGGLTVWVQQSLDGGYNWDDLVGFSGTGVFTDGVQYASLPVRVSGGGGEVHAQEDASLSEGTARATVVGRTFRVVWTFVGTSINASFQVLAIPRG